MVSSGISTWRQLWFDHLAASSIDDAKLRPGKMFVERNDELEIDISPGRIEMEIRSGPRMVYDVSIHAPKATQQGWELFDKNIESNPALLSEVSLGELPIEAGIYAQSESIGIIPHWSDFESSCSCPNPDRCKHIYALLYYLGEHFDEDPFELMRFLGRTREQFLASITSSTTSFEYRPQLAVDAWTNDLPELPMAPELAIENYQLTSWPTDPPHTPLFDAEGLRSIGEDALKRATEMLLNQTKSYLQLDEKPDLIRRAAYAEDTKQFIQNSDFSSEDLAAYVETWNRAGDDGVDAHISPSMVVPIDERSAFHRSQSNSWYTFTQDGNVLRFDRGPVDPPETS